MSMEGQGTAGGGDLVTAIQGVIRQLSSLVRAFQGRITFGSFTFGAAATAVVANTAVEANSNISWTPTNASAAALEGSAKKLYLSAISPGVGFTVATGNSASAAGTETFQYVVQTPS